jgi:hypothetical protein
MDASLVSKQDRPRIQQNYNIEHLRPRIQLRTHTYNSTINNVGEATRHTCQVVEQYAPPDVDKLMLNLPHFLTCTHLHHLLSMHAITSPKFYPRAKCEPTQAQYVLQSNKHLLGWIFWGPFSCFSSMNHKKNVKS